MAQKKKSWSDLTTFQRRCIAWAAGAEGVLTLAAIRDIVRRPSTQVRGPKWLWVTTFVVQPFGPLAYFAKGRR